MRARAGPWSLLPQLAVFTWVIMLEISFVVSAHSHRSGAVSQCSLDVRALECPTAVLLQSQPDEHGWSAAYNFIFSPLSHSSVESL